MQEIVRNLCFTLIPISKTFFMKDFSSRWLMIAAVIFLIAPLGLSPAFGNPLLGKGLLESVGWFILCYFFIQPLILAVFGVIACFVFITITLLEEASLLQRFPPRTKRAIAIGLGVPLGLFLAWIGLNGSGPIYHIW